MVDRDDDIQIGVKSTAILFGDFDKRIVAFLQILTLCLLLTVGEMLAFGWPFQLSLVVAAGLFCYQQMMIARRERRSLLCCVFKQSLGGLSYFYRHRY